MRTRLRLALLLLAFGAAPARADPDALWHIVHDRCVPDQQAHGVPTPCMVVDLAGGTVVLKDNVGDTQFLLLPTARVTGIEDKTVLAPAAPNYFAAAWQARGLVEQRAGRSLPREAIGLAINSRYGRTQNQLHIHIDCLRPDVIAALRAHGPSVGGTWARFPVPLAGHSYLARRLGRADVADANPFVLLADGVPGARTEMGRWTLVVAGVTIAGAPDLLLLADHLDLSTGDRASGEELQDHACAIKAPGGGM
jgi:CDP-diacylglycerol pyrophosphatase